MDNNQENIIKENETPVANNNRRYGRNKLETFDWLADVPGNIDETDFVSNPEIVDQIVADINNLYANQGKFEF